MRQAKRAGKVQTVLGLIDADDLGVTLPHEHLLIDLSAYFVEPTEASERRMAYELITLENLCWVRNHMLSNLDELKLTDEKLAIKEALLYKCAGGNTIVEMSNFGLHRDPLGLARISRATGLNIVMGAGYYIDLSHPPDLATKSEEEITEEIVRDIMVGVGGTGIRAGIIGEIGCSAPLEESERRVLRASARAQRQTGVAINIHPSPTDDLVLEIIKVLDEAAADLSRTIISHVHIRGFSLTTLHRLADAGCYLEFDTFGHSYPGFHPLYQGYVQDLSSDLRRIHDMGQLIAGGYLNHILMSQDLCLKHHYVTYGGCGYAHILNNVVPWMRRVGISDEQIHIIMLENPKRLLQLTTTRETN